MAGIGREGGTVSIAETMASTSGVSTLPAHFVRFRRYQLRLARLSALSSRNSTLSFPTEILAPPISSAKRLSMVCRCRGRESFGVSRSEEHTSELQSLMRYSYAVFCWNKKKTKLRTPQRRSQL